MIALTNVVCVLPCIVPQVMGNLVCFELRTYQDR